jgi:hypothetical protein
MVELVLVLGAAVGILRGQAKLSSSVVSVNTVPVASPRDNTDWVTYYREIRTFTALDGRVITPEMQWVVPNSMAPASFLPPVGADWTWPGRMLSGPPSSPPYGSRP